MTPGPRRWPLRLPRIDDAPGPAAKIRQEAAAAIVEAAMARHLRRTDSLSRIRLYAGAAGIVGLLGALLAAAFL